MEMTAVKRADRWVSEFQAARAEPPAAALLPKQGGKRAGRKTGGGAKPGLALAAAAASPPPANPKDVGVGHGRRVLVYSLPFAGAALFTYVLAQTPRSVAILRLYGGFTAPSVADLLGEEAVAIPDVFVRAPAHPKTPFAVSSSTMPCPGGAAAATAAGAVIANATNTATTDQLASPLRSTRPPSSRTTPCSSCATRRTCGLP